MFQTKIIEDLTAEPVSLEEIKSFLEIDFSDFDTLLSLLGKSARQASEQFTGLSYGKKKIELVSDQGRVNIPFGPFVSLDSITDKDGNAIAASNYTLFGYGAPFIDVRLTQPCWDGYDRSFDILGSLRNSSSNFYTVTYYAGYYTEADTVVTNTLPAALKEAILKRVANGFQFREDSTEAAVNACTNASVYLEQSFKTNPIM